MAKNSFKKSILLVVFLSTFINIAFVEPNELIQGELSVDNKIDFNDYAILASNWLDSSESEPNIPEGWPVNYNGPPIVYNRNDYAYSMTRDNIGNIIVTGRSSDGSYFDYATIKFDPNGDLIWKVRYNNDSDITPNSIVSDVLGNIYIAGVSKNGSYYDYVTIKYDPNGNQLWAKKYNGSNGLNDKAYAIAIDNLSNVYVTGYANYLGTGSDYATIKYDTNGNQIWVARYNAANASDVAHAIIIDSSGNIFVTGESIGTGKGYDYATVKYDQNGNQIWVARYDGPHFNDTARSIALDDSGNIYVTGESLNPAMDSDYATIKYAPDGNQLWVSRYNYGSDFACSILTDGSGDIYVTGYSYGLSTGYDFATIKYDPNGTQIWANRYNGPANSDDYSRVMTFDSLGNIYVTGESTGSGTAKDFATIKYDPIGNQIWVARYNGPADGNDYAKAVTADNLGNIYVAGYDYEAETGYDYALIKYDPNGNQLWLSKYINSASSSDFAYALISDNSGNIYVTGRSNKDYTTIKYDPNGNQLWIKRYNGSANDSDTSYAITIDSLGNIYTAGCSTNLETGYDYTTIKYDPNENQIWVSIYDGTGNGSDVARAILNDNLENIYVTGESMGLGMDYDFATIKYDSNGNQLWINRYNGPGNSADEVSDICIDGRGNIYITGKSSGSGSGRDYATIKYDSNGNQLWVARYNGPVNDADIAYAIATDNFENIYVTGQSMGSETGYDYATIKYDSNGNQLWVSRYNGPGNAGDESHDITTDSGGNIYVTGVSYGLETGGDYATIKYDPNGNQIWVSRYNGPANAMDDAYRIALDNLGNIYVTGYSGGSGTGWDYATIKYDPEGNQIWTSRYNGPGNKDDIANNIIIDNVGNAYVTGESEGFETKDDYLTIKYSQKCICQIEFAGDLNGDCKVDVLDLAIFAQHWLEGT